MTTAPSVNFAAVLVDGRFAVVNRQGILVLVLDGDACTTEGFYIAVGPSGSARSADRHLLVVNYSTIQPSANDE